MAKMTVVDPHHWMEPDGTLPADGPVRAKAVRVAQCIEYGGPLAIAEGRNTLIPCRFRPEGLPCPGFLIVIKQPDDTILALCDHCEQNEFLIHNWQDTHWAEGPPDPVPLSLKDEDGDEAPQAQMPPSAESGGDLDMDLARALTGLGSTLSAAELRRIIATAHMPGDVLKRILNSLNAPPDRAALEDLLPLVLQAWNDTPRPELGGVSPNQKRNAPPPSRPASTGPSRNAPCPCGSGKKYKRCCLKHAAN